MRILLLCLAFTLPVSFVATGQSKQKAEKEFLQQLNKILKSSKQQHWEFEGTMSVDSAFAINEAGVLSVTVRYTGDSAVVRSRMEAPVNKIRSVAYDLYIILEYKDDLVGFYQSDSATLELREKYKTNLFHIGVPMQQGLYYQEKLQNALDKLLKYY